jgi:two-component system OmpR family sensor kinase
LLAEKKALKRFLLIYILSTLFLVGIGEWFYYKSKINAIINSEVVSLNSKLKIYLTENRMRFRRFFFDLKLPRDLKIAVFKDKRYIYGNFKPEKVYWDREFWIENNKVYYIYTIPKRWGRLDFVVYKRMNLEKIANLKRQLLFFTFVVLVFTVIIALILGKIFLKPMKETLNSLENFIRDAAHEMNTPISVILTNIEMLKMKNIDFKELKRIEFSAKRLETIFKDLTFVRLNHKRKKNFKNINLKNFINNRLLHFETLIENKKLKIKTECEPFILKIDEEDLNRLIDNILSNAIKYSPINSKIEIILKNNFLCVINDGEIKNIKKITQKFVRENENEGGFGLGLYIVKKICDEYGFKLKIENKNKKVNTCLYFV